MWLSAILSCRERRYKPRVYCSENCSTPTYTHIYLYICTSIYYIPLPPPPMAGQPPVGQGLLNIDSSRSHSDTPYSVELLCTSDQPDSENSTCQHPTHKRLTSMTPAVFEPTIPASQRPQTEALDRAATGIGTYII